MNVKHNNLFYADIRRISFEQHFLFPCDMFIVSVDFNYTPKNHA